MRQYLYGRLYVIKKERCGWHLSHGYKFLSIPGNKNGIAEHRKIMQDFIGRPLKKGEQVHHIDGNKLNNSIENLELCANQKEHSGKHLALKRNATHKECCTCHKFLQRNLYIKKWRGRPGLAGTDPELAECKNCFKLRAQQYRVRRFFKRKIKHICS